MHLRSRVLAQVIGVGLLMGGVAAADVVTIPQSALVPSVNYYTDSVGGGIGSPLVMTGGGNAANVGGMRNDDGFSGPNDLGFTLNFFGNDYTQFWANNNGNISFNGGIAAFTPSGPQGATQPIISPFFVGMIADRYFASQKVMGVLYLLGGAIMHFAANSTATGPLILLLLLYNLTYMPTLALVNAVSFHQMKSPEKEFPRVRVWGTIGWIVAGLTIWFIQFHYLPQVEKSELPDRREDRLFMDQLLRLCEQLGAFFVVEFVGLLLV